MKPKHLFRAGLIGLLLLLLSSAALFLFGRANLTRGWVKAGRVEWTTKDQSETVTMKGTGSLSNVAAWRAPAGLESSVTNLIKTLPEYGVRCSPAEVCKAFENELPHDANIEITITEWRPARCSMPFYSEVEARIVGTIRTSAVAGGLWHDSSVKMDIRLDGRSRGLYQCADLPDLGKLVVKKVNSALTEPRALMRPATNDDVVKLVHGDNDAGFALTRSGAVWLLNNTDAPRKLPGLRIASAAYGGGPLHPRVLFVEGGRLHVWTIAAGYQADSAIPAPVTTCSFRDLSRVLVRSHHVCLINERGALACEYVNDDLAIDCSAFQRKLAHSGNFAEFVTSPWGGVCVTDRKHALHCNSDYLWDKFAPIRGASNVERVIGPLSGPRIVDKVSATGTSSHRAYTAICYVTDGKTRCVDRWSGKAIHVEELSSAAVLAEPVESLNESIFYRDAEAWKCVGGDCSSDDPIGAWPFASSVVAHWGSVSVVGGRDGVWVQNRPNKGTPTWVALR